jgi:hypothetical protein
MLAIVSLKTIARQNGALQNVRRLIFGKDNLRGSLFRHASTPSMSPND